jgi:copper(I)-binding protein
VKGSLRTFAEPQFRPAPAREESFVFGQLVTVRRGLGLAVAASLLTAGCAAGQLAATADQNPTQDGTDAAIGSIALRGVAVQTPPTGVAYQVGSDAQLRIVLANSSRTADRLTSITTSVAAGWGAFKTTADANAVRAADESGGASSSASAPSSSSSAPAAASSAPTATPGASLSANGGSQPAGSSSSSATSSASSSATSSAPAAPALPTPQTSVTIPPQGRVLFGVPAATGALMLMHLKSKVYPGSSLTLTFTFADAGSITIVVPVQLSKSAHTSVIPGPSATEQQG